MMNLCIIDLLTTYLQLMAPDWPRVMTSVKWHQFSLATLMSVCMLVALPFGITAGWRGDDAFFVCTWLALALWIVTRRKIYAYALLAYILAFPVGAIILVANANPSSAYVRNFNERLERMANNAALVGSNEDRVEIVLGRATSIYRGWNATVMATGEPARGARYYTTYNYAPYPSLPVAKFQVHCCDGKV